MRFAIAFALIGLEACSVQLEPPARGSLNSRFSSELNPSASLARQQGARSEEPAAVLPIFIIDVKGDEAIPRDREVPGELTVIEDHDGSLKKPSANPVAMRSKASFQVHGESSSSLSKQSYRFEVLDDKEENRDLPLVGLPPGSDWVLHSCASDRSCLRNVLAYELGRELGRYAPRTRFVELILDGDYRGLYVLVERIRRDRHRVDLPRPSATSSEGDITGGYIFKMDLGEGTPADKVPRDWVAPVSRTVYSYYFPRYNQITVAQRAYLHDHVSRFEKALQGSGWNDPDSGYRAWIDVPSWIDFAIIQELSVNPDAYFKSVYLQKLPSSKGNKIALGPFWDFDLAFGMAEFRDGRNTQAWAHKMNRFGAERVPSYPGLEVPYVPAYWERLWTDPAFQRDLRCRWQVLRRGPLKESALNAKIEEWADQVKLAQPRDAAVWSNPPANAYEGEVQSLQAFLAKRLAWMDANLPGRCAA